jgi:hypothetical protein
MSKLVVAELALAVLIGSLATASAFRSDLTSHPDPLLMNAANFEGIIPTEARPIIGVKRLAKMRREGKLPDTFVRRPCTYNLAGDTGAAYYVKTCR